MEELISMAAISGRGVMTSRATLSPNFTTDLQQLAIPFFDQALLLARGNQFLQIFLRRRRLGFRFGGFQQPARWWWKSGWER